MQRLGIVDLGSNTARLVVFEYEAGRSFALVDEIRERIRLGAGLAADGRLSPQAIDRASAALHLFADYAAATGLGKLEVIATSAVREAANRDEILRRIDSLPLEVQVLSGEEEARLSVLAVANGFDLEDAWVVDLGGGSIQVSLMQGRDFAHGRSFPLGAVRVTEEHLGSDPPQAEEVEALRRAVKDELGGVAREIADSKLPMVGMGGTIRNLAHAVQKHEAYPLALLHGYLLEASSLGALTDRLTRLTIRRRARVRGINPDRADIILGGALVIGWLIEAAGVRGLRISGQGVREGAFYRRFFPPPFRPSDIREFSLENLFAQYPQPREHVERVRKLARALFDGLRPLHGMGDAETELLDAAALLHDSGMTVSYYRHHKHGAYLISSAALNGFSQREQALISLLVRYHRRGSPSLGPYKKLMRDGDHKRLLAMATCLRLAELLERSRAGRVSGLTVRLTDGSVRVDLQASEEPTVEIWEAGKHAALFEQAFGRRLELRSVVVPAEPGSAAV